MNRWRWAGIVAIVIGLLSFDGSPSSLGAVPTIATASILESSVRFVMAPQFNVPVQVSTGYDYMAPPSISRERFMSIICGYRSSPVCPEAGDIYDFLVGEGFDPVLALAHMRKETEFGTTGIGTPGQPPNESRGLYGVDCNGDADWCDGGRPQSAFYSYLNATKAWVKLMKSPTYIGRGLTSPDLVLPVYCPSSECGTQGYIENMHNWIREWRALQ